ncbi:L-serine dehydratase, iron-sulfur-dependent subunit beta [Anoxybacter fermentans]|uniref:L-serine deaminase n=1 Tax=Anoxybacter fermentans TaxID=1323375 RepID=A0A3Q9HR52_9FIRM|nr:L-serine ammonia-lyase, iron-sulfur-dependent subunit beta [Anoxybacter fermentans]AZR72715.1 L-serine dehydratase, iron-sulfur-dependent subunit beta [Anoxybacter fermentans]
MEKLSIFEVMGPIMIGPSSSHTAGAVRIGNMARKLLDEEPKVMKIYFHGSFAETYKGHGTDVAIVGGLLGFGPDDERICNSLDIAKEKGIQVEFYRFEMPNAHPNTIKLELTRFDGTTLEVVGSSIGGGEIRITRINRFSVNLTGKYPTVWILHIDKPGIIAKVTSTLALNGINIAFMEVFREDKGALSSMVIQTDQDVSEDVVREINSFIGVKLCRYIQPI